MKFLSLFEAESTGKGISPLATNEPITPDGLESMATPKTPVTSSSEVTEQNIEEDTNVDGPTDEGKTLPRICTSLLYT